MDKLSEIRQPIEAELKAYRTLFEQTLRTDNPLLQLALDHLLRRRGKMMRPILVLLAARLYGPVGPGVLHAAVALELLHTASLVHDDVVDESDRRRGQQSVNALLDNKAAVLVGDFLLSKALFHAAATGSGRVVQWVAELGQALADGELHQLANLDKTDFSEDDYFEVIRKKTASLFETCTRAAVWLAGGGEEEAERMGRFGLLTGLCFQMRDDLLDFDFQHDTGKPCGNDLREGKLTLPVIHALLQAGETPMGAVALKVRRGEQTDEEIAALVRFAQNGGGLEYTAKKMNKIGEEALRILTQGPVAEPSIGESLADYVRYVVGRDI